MTFADAPAAEAPDVCRVVQQEPAARSSSNKPNQAGLKKGFLDRPRPVLKKTSSITEREEALKAAAAGTAAAAAERAAQEQQEDPLERRQVDEGRDAAFSGRVMERVPGARAEAAASAAASSGSGSSIGHAAGAAAAAVPERPEAGMEKAAMAEPAASAGEPAVKKVSRFKQQRAQAGLQ